jgi:hypothetical protein
MKDLIGKNKIYAIKSAFVAKLENDGHTLTNFNEFLKRQLKVVAQKHFKNIASYNAIIEYAKREYEKQEKSDSYRYYNYGSVDRQFMFHMLNIFGLDYGKFISNKKLSEAVDNTMILEFFAHTVHDSKFAITRFNETDYLNHMTKLLSDLGIKDVDSNQIRNGNVAYNYLLQTIENRLYGGDKATLAIEYAKIIKTEVSEKYTLPKISEIRENIKAEVDKNPMLKYILGSHQVSGNLRELKTNKNPINQLDERNSYYNNNGKDWFSQMSQDNVDLFKIQLSSLIR